MTTHMLPSAEITGAVTRCPGCSSSHTTWIAAADRFLCKTCGTCWQPAGEHVDRVDPRQCSGCGLRPICRAANF